MGTDDDRFRRPPGGKPEPDEGELEDLEPDEESAGGVLGGYSKKNPPDPGGSTPPPK